MIHWLCMVPKLSFATSWISLPKSNSKTRDGSGLQHRTEQTEAPQLYREFNYQLCLASLQSKWLLKLNPSITALKL